MKIQATYTKTTRELNFQMEEKRMTFDVLNFPFKDIFEWNGEIYNIHFLMDGSLWVGQDGVMQEYEIEIQG